MIPFQARRRRLTQGKRGKCPKFFFSCNSQEQAIQCIKVFGCLVYVGAPKALKPSINF